MCGRRRCLPGWSRGHVLAHIAGNADSLVNLLTWAATGVEHPQYASQEARDAAIEAGAGDPIAAQIARLEASHQRFVDAVDRVPRRELAPPRALDVG